MRGASEVTTICSDLGLYGKARKIARYTKSLQFVVTSGYTVKHANLPKHVHVHGKLTFFVWRFAFAKGASENRERVAACDTWTFKAKMCEN